MRTRGTGILQSDVAVDVHADYLAAFDRGEEPDQIVEALLAQYAECLEDVDDGPYVWLAIGTAQWRCGNVSNRVLAEIDRIVESGEALSRWADERPALAAKARAAVAALSTELRGTNPRPRTRRKPIQRKPIYVTGDCLAVKLSDGHYGAAIVLTCPEVTEPGRETYGINCIGVLRYRSLAKPDAAVFERREWFEFTHGFLSGRLEVVNVAATGHRKLRDRFEVVCRTAIRGDDPQQSDVFINWEQIGEQNVYEACRSSAGRREP